MQAHGWTILVHDCLATQLRKLHDAGERARVQDPEGYCSNANVRAFAALARLMLDTVPQDPGRAAYRQGNTLGAAHRHWRRAKFGGRFRLFFRYDSRSRIIVYAWVNDEKSLRQRGGRNDPYAVFQKMLDRGHPPGDWRSLLASADDPPSGIDTALSKVFHRK